MSGASPPRAQFPELSVGIAGSGSTGGYVKDCVFFIDERTAKAAGYRPCAVCMPAEYKNWKTVQSRRPKKA